MKTVGEKIAYLRKERKLSQEALGLEIGVSRSAIVKWEKGLMNPNHDSINLLCEYFKVDANYFYEDHTLLNEKNECVKEIAITTATSKSKYRICIISLIIISIFFLLTLLSTTAFGFIAFTNNIGYQSEKTTDINDIIFYISLSFCFVFLILLVIFIVKLKSRQK